MRGNGLVEPPQMVLESYQKVTILLPNLRVDGHLVGIVFLSATRG
jgi:hypothetical protein